jgi:hypothetical protein
MLLLIFYPHPLVDTLGPQPNSTIERNHLINHGRFNGHGQSSYATQPNPVYHGAICFTLFALSISLTAFLSLRFSRRQWKWWVQG